MTVTVTDGPGGVPGTVEPAAGVVCWREASGASGKTDPERSLEVLVVHRPAYDDWSFPKGKVEAAETLPECAVREAAEETGARVRLGRPLPTVQYPLPDGRWKVVAYWTARALSGTGAVKRLHEVDDVAWLPVRTARKRLSHETDRALLDTLLDAHRERRLATVPLLVLRHAAARPRHAWTHADADRPLVAAGRRQALALAPLLQCWSPEYVLSSPWQRCTDTLEPFAALTGTRVRTKGGLSERGHERDPDKAVRHLRGLLERDQAALLCTHRPVLPAVLDELGRHAGDATVRDDLPCHQPFLEAAELLVAHVGRQPRDRRLVVAVERHAPHR